MPVPQEDLSLAISNLTRQVEYLGQAVQRISGPVAQSTSPAGIPAAYADFAQSMNQQSALNYSFQMSRMLGNQQGGGAPQAPVEQLTPSQYGIYRQQPEPYYRPFTAVTDMAGGFNQFMFRGMNQLITPPNVNPFEYLHQSIDRQQQQVLLASSQLSQTGLGLASFTANKAWIPGAIGGFLAGGLPGAALGAGIGLAAGKPISSILSPMAAFAGDYTSTYTELASQTIPFVSGGTARSYFGRGLNTQALHDLTSRVEKLSINPQFRWETGSSFNRQTLMETMGTGVEAGFFDMYQNPGEITKQLSNVAKTARSLMQIAGDPDIQTAVRELGQFRTMGLSLQGSLGLANNVQHAARMAGSTFRTILDTVGAAGGEMFQGAGFTAGLGVGVGAMSQGYARLAVASQAFNPQQLALGGGISGLQQTLMQSSAASLAMPVPLMSVLSMGREGLNLDPTAMQNMALGITNGSDMIRGAASRMSAAGVRGISDLSWRQRELQDQMGQMMGPQANLLMTFRHAANLQDMLGGQVDIGSVFRMMGFSEQQAGNLRRMSTSGQFWNNIQSQEDTRLQESQLRRLQNMAYSNSLEGMVFGTAPMRIGGFTMPSFQEMVYNIRSPIVNAVTGFHGSISDMERQIQAERMGGYYSPGDRYGNRTDLERRGLREWLNTDAAGRSSLMGGDFNKRWSEVRNNYRAGRLAYDVGVGVVEGLIGPTLSLVGGVGLQVAGWDPASHVPTSEVSRLSDLYGGWGGVGRSTARILGQGAIGLGIDITRGTLGTGWLAGALLGGAGLGTLALTNEGDINVANRVVAQRESQIGIGTAFSRSLTMTTQERRQSRLNLESRYGRNVDDRLYRVARELNKIEGARVQGIAGTLKNLLQTGPGGEALETQEIIQGFIRAGYSREEAQRMISDPEMMARLGTVLGTDQEGQRILLGNIQGASVLRGLGMNDTVDTINERIEKSFNAAAGRGLLSFDLSDEAVEGVIGLTMRGGGKAFAVSMYQKMKTKRPQEAEELKRRIKENYRLTEDQFRDLEDQAQDSGFTSGLGTEAKNALTEMAREGTAAQIMNVVETSSAGATSKMIRALDDNLRSNRVFRGTGGHAIENRMRQVISSASTVRETVSGLGRSVVADYKRLKSLGSRRSDEDTENMNVMRGYIGRDALRRIESNTATLEDYTNIGANALPEGNQESLGVTGGTSFVQRMRQNMANLISGNNEGVEMSDEERMRSGSETFSSAVSNFSSAVDRMMRGGNGLQ